ncbi:hypothetical protein ABW20_dc0100469 [Dactylellina cionopaga]|nr:hypothetical protein ABW20_dc0100469 [Dactylellina cionopaga]
MATTPLRRRGRLSSNLNDDKENIPPPSSLRRPPTRRSNCFSLDSIDSRVPTAVVNGTTDEEEEEPEENIGSDDYEDPPFLSLSTHGMANWRAISAAAAVAEKPLFRSGSEERDHRMEGFSGRVQVLRDTTAEYKNDVGSGRRRFGDEKRKFNMVGSPGYHLIESEIEDVVEKVEDVKEEGEGKTGGGFVVYRDVEEEEEQNEEEVEAEAKTRAKDQSFNPNEEEEEGEISEIDETQIYLSEDEDLDIRSEGDEYVSEEGEMGIDEEEVFEIGDYDEEEEHINYNTEDEYEETSIELQSQRDDEELHTEASKDDNHIFQLRTDNIALRSKLHPPPFSALRSTHLSETEAQRAWAERKAKLIERNEAEIFEDPSSILNRPIKPYIRPRRRIRTRLAQPAIRLCRHLGLINPNGQSSNSRTAATYRWLKGQDDILLDQVALVAPRMQYQHIREVHEFAYKIARPTVLNHLRVKYPSSTWCMFFSEFVYFADEARSFYNSSAASGSCLFLMVNTEDIKNLTGEIEWIVRDLKFGDELAVIVRKGDPRLFRSYGLPKEDEGSEGGERNDNEANSSVRGWFNPFSKQGPDAAPNAEGQRIPGTTPKIPQKFTKRIGSLSPSPTPEPNSPIKGVYNFDFKNQWQELRAFHYGMRWVTKLDGIPSAEEGAIAKYEAQPNIGASLGSNIYYASGTMGGYLTDRKGDVYVMTCRHVMDFGGQNKGYPQKTNALTVIKDLAAVAPAQPDLRATTAACAHEIDGLLHEAVRARIKGDKELSQRLSNEGRRKIQLHDRHVQLLEAGGSSFGKVIGSGWRIMRTRDGPWMMDQVVVKPHKHRIGTNTFTYLGRDNKEGKRYRIEARGWTNLELGDDVLKLGRTTGLTKGKVVCLDADLRICLGDTGTSKEPTNISTFWEIKAGVITSGAGPWFSEPGDSGAWVLKAPKFEDMLRWDLRRMAGKAVYDPIAAPVGGMMFGGADSVDGVALTFYNPSRLVRAFMGRMVEGGEDLQPGFGEPLPEPEPLSEEWEAADQWSRQHEKTMDAWEDFATGHLWDYQMKRYTDNHILRDMKWGEDWDRKMLKSEGVGRTNDFSLARMRTAPYRKVREDVKAGQELRTSARNMSLFDDGESMQSTQRPRSTRVVDTPRRRNTTEEAPDTPTPERQSNSKKKQARKDKEAQKSRPKHMSIKPLKKRDESQIPNRMQPRYRLISPEKARVRRTIVKIENFTSGSSSEVESV